MASRRALPVALTIAGSDPSAGAGLQADLKTFHQHGVYGTSVVTLVTVQTTRGVSRVELLAPDLVREQLATLLADVPPQAMKTGALGTASIVRAVAEVLAEIPKDARPPLIVDPVMVSKHGHALLDETAIDACLTALFPLAALVTPNVPEAERLLATSPEAERDTWTRIETEDDAADAAAMLARRFGVPVLLKGGHLQTAMSTDVLAFGGEVHRFDAPRLDTPHTHGTGCTYSTAITARLARGFALPAAVAGAKAWLTRAIASGPAIGGGIGPTDHLAPTELGPVEPTRASVAPISGRG